MDAFWCILLSFLVIRAFIRSERAKREERAEMIAAYQRKEEAKRKKERKVKITRKKPELAEEEKLQAEIEKQKQRDIEDLRKQGYSEDIIAMILPTINNG